MYTRFLLIFLSSVALLAAGKKKDKTDRGPAFDPNHIEVSIRYMEPLRWSPRSVAYGYSLAIDGDSVRVYLPYMGVAHQPNMDSDGLDFEKPLTSMRQIAGKKGRTQLIFSCQKGIVEYWFKLTIYPNGKAFLRLSPSNADAIDYEGELTGG
ncbi:MAG: DUF4251 domain-containing protein [Bacteroidaceae bacterium]|nr:DUF4251 domain-containing protein [Bacteroidaceae bacterium]